MLVESYRHWAVLHSMENSHANSAKTCPCISILPDRRDVRQFVESTSALHTGCAVDTLPCI